jgi:hypothetical protein
VSAARDSLHGVEYLWNALRLYSLAGAQKDLLRLAYVDARARAARGEKQGVPCADDAGQPGDGVQTLNQNRSAAPTTVCRL